VRAVKILAVVEDLALDDRSRDQAVQVVEAADERAFAAAGRPDERGDEVPVDLERNVLECCVAVIGHTKVLDVEDDFAELLRGELAGSRGEVDAHAGNCC
jgi:hypothetical protein